MRHPEYSTVDPRTGSVNYHGPSEIMPGNHKNMPHRTEAAYLPEDERGHVQASSLGGTNGPENIVAMNANVNHGGYYSLEEGERTALKNGAAIDSDKTAFVSNQPRQRPGALMVNDTVTYPDGHTEQLHFSFQNESYAMQDLQNEEAAALPDTFDAPNPGDMLRESMDAQSYASLMEETDAALPDIRDDYAPADYSGAPPSSEPDVSGSTASSDVSAGPDADADPDPGADPDPDSD